MFSLQSLTLLTALGALTAARPAPQSSPAPSSSTYWMANMDHSQDTVWDPQPDGPSGNYTIFRDVTTFGADPTGVQDSTAAINQAMAEGGRCGGGPPEMCDSTTVYPAILYFPPGTYTVSKPITMYYYTQMIGDPTNIPTIQASADFVGMAMIDADPYAYLANGSAVNWYVNQNNFFRQIRNFVIDVRPWGGGTAGGAGIHWQVAQATSLQNIVFELSDTEGNSQQGIFMDNGSGGFMADLTFNNGGNCAFLGSQQFTSRNLTFNNCQTAVYMNWNWGWTLQGLNINGGQVGLNMSNVPTNQTVGSVVLADSVMTNVDTGVVFAYQNSSSNYYPTGGTLVLDNVDMTGAKTAVANIDGTEILAGGQKVASWASGNGYSPARGQGSSSTTALQGSRQENNILSPKKAPGLLDSNGNLVTASRPQYETLPASSFISAKSNGCAGDGVTDDAAAITNVLQMSAKSGQVAYFEHGAYLVKSTVQVPAGAKMTGEIWPLILADGASFNKTIDPTPVFQVGSDGEQGSFQISDFVFETLGPASGAIMIQWNLAGSPGESGMWDVHVRIGGSAGTDLEGPEEYGNCLKDPTNPEPSFSCEGVFMMFHASKSASNLYLENTWFWVADHDLDVGHSEQISLYSARGVLINAQGPVWLWGTAAEHSIMYQYQIDGAQAVFGGFMQTETPYFQPNPPAVNPFTFNTTYDDPEFTVCANAEAAVPCKDAWGMRIVNSQNILIYGTGMYSFFNNYDQDCVGTRNCQQNMIHIQGSQVDMYTVNTANSVSMILDDGVGTVAGSDNENWFCDTVAFYFTSQ